MVAEGTEHDHEDPEDGVADRAVAPAYPGEGRQGWTVEDQGGGLVLAEEKGQGFEQGWERGVSATTGHDPPLKGLWPVLWWTKLCGSAGPPQTPVTEAAPFVPYAELAAAEETGTGSEPAEELAAPGVSIWSFSSFWATPPSGTVPMPDWSGPAPGALAA